MAILKVARMGHPVLRAPAEAIPPEEVTSAPVQQLIEDMLDTCEEYDGIGLAAPQVHFSVQVVILEIDDQGPTVWINPKLTPLTDELIYTFEGCLSVPGLRGMVGRPGSIKVEALDRNGEAIEMVLHGFPAVVAQHECDHLMGELYVDKVVPQSLTFLEEHRRFSDWMTESDEEDVDEQSPEAEVPTETTAPPIDPIPASNLPEFVTQQLQPVDPEEATADWPPTPESTDTEDQ